jgi:hypothetical protein
VVCESDIVVTITVDRYAEKFGSAVAIYTNDMVQGISLGRITTLTSSLLKVDENKVDQIEKSIVVASREGGVVMGRRGWGNNICKR